MFIVLDIGGTKLRIAESSDGISLENVQIFNTPQSYSEALHLLKLELPKFIDNKGELKGIAAGVPAVLNEDNTEIVRAANLPDWSGKPFAQDLNSLFKCPVKLENDAVLGALAEAKTGAGKEFDSVTYISIGTGIGGGWIVDGKIQKATRNFEPGHHVIEPDGPVCPSDKIKGHWEAYLQQDNFIDYLAIGIYDTLQKWPSDVVVLGGGVTLHSNWDLEKISEQLNTLNKEEGDVQAILNPSLKICQYGDEAGLYGGLEILK